MAALVPRVKPQVLQLRQFLLWNGGLLIALIAIGTIIDRRAYCQEKNAEAAVASISGKIVDERFQDIAGASVRCFHGETEIGKATTDDNGKYILSLPVLHRQVLTLVADDPTNDRIGYLMTEAPEGQNPAALPQVTLQPTRHTLLKVVDANGAPVAGATYTVPGSHYSWGDLLLTGTTDAKGLGKLRYTDDAFAYQVVAFKSGVGFDYYVSPEKSPGMSPGWNPDAKLGDPLPDLIILKLAGARTLQIKSVGDAGAPVAGVSFSPDEITVKGKPWAVAALHGASIMQGKTDAAGVATFDWLPQNFVGEMTFRGGSAPGQNIGITTIKARELLTVYAKHPVDEVTIPLQRRLKITGHVYSDDGKPAAGITLQSQIGGREAPASGRQRSKPDGSYSINVAVEKQYNVGIINDRWIAPNKIVSPNADNVISDVDFHLADGAIVRGTITNGPDQPVSGQYVELISDLPPAVASAEGTYDVHLVYGPLSYSRAVQTDAQGHFQFCVPAGNYALFPGLWGNKGADSRRIDFKVTDQHEMVKNFELPQLETIPLTGKVIDADSKPLAGQPVIGGYVEHTDYSNGSFRSTTKADGTFTVQRVAVSAIVLVNPPRTNSGGAAVVNAQQREVTIQVLPYVEAHGRLVDDQGSSVTDGHLLYGIKVPTNFEAYTIGELNPGGDGSYTLRYLIPGVEYAIYWEESRDSRPRRFKTFTSEGGNNLELGDTPLPTQENSASAKAADSNQ